MPPLTKEKSAEAIVPAGKKDEPGRAERTSEGPLTKLAEEAMTAANLTSMRLRGRG